MTHRLRITSEAADRLFEIAQWYAQTSQSLEIATAWYDRFLDELDSLKQNPFRCGLASESALFDFELRELHYGSGKRITHRALYRIVGKTVEVLTIRHSAQHPLRPSDLRAPGS